jgi:stage V sporulation protein R
MKQIMASTDWSQDRLIEIFNELEKLNEEKYKYDLYPNQIEIVPYSWMIDNHSSHGGLPILYKHWSFGKAFVKFSNAYKARQTGLAYEMIINTNPCIAYCMEENTEVMQTLVMAHASFGHNFVFKNNYLFQQWTDAAEILNYLEFARIYVSRCEEKYGEKQVELFLDAAHTLQFSSFTRYPRSRKYSVKDNEQRRLARVKDYEKDYNEIWESIPRGKKDAGSLRAEYKARMNLPEENILYFLEKYSPNLSVWQREILRIVRSIGQYFYPNIQTNLVHEAAATWTHHSMLNDLYDKGLIHDGGMMEWLHSHSSVVYQPTFNQKFGPGHFNPYALGFAMCKDMERVCLNPTKEDKEWFPDIAGSKDYIGLLKYIWSNFRNESFVRQYLSPKVIRDLRMFSVRDDSTEDTYTITNIHDKEGYKQVRSILADSYLVENMIPNVEVVDADILGDRTLSLEFVSANGHRLYPRYAQKTLDAIADIWGYPVKLNENYSSPSKRIKTETYEANPTRPFNESFMI